MSVDAAHTRWWQIFEVIVGIPLLVAIALQIGLPLALPLGALALAVRLGGAACAIAGVVLVVLTRRQFARHHQPTDPGFSTGQIITTGVFSISRNPLYLGGICMLAGVGLALNAAWVLLSLVPALIGCSVLLVAPEERYLAAKFGADYTMYAARVHRWIGRARRRP